MLAASSELESPVFRCKWSLPVIIVLASGPRRFSELSRSLGASPKTLAKKLEMLVLHGYIKSGGYGYVLAERGETVAEIVRPLTRHIDVKALADVIKCKWSREILVLLLKGPCYSSEVVAALPGISWKVASERLRKLVGHGLVSRFVEASESPVRIRYDLTVRGKLLASWLKTYVMAGRPSSEYKAAQSYYSV
ncbi:MAG: winged helix-turn-helix transcriptional regulator [Candidatus Caldarchaeum sp.]|nr:winged helix-turn-helix transcriptional regulator [Candidatus Caldarchaeum sp.]MCX8200577.1 winged helix-turn-helix transcriptional regulator [Candidatus Caldarchaeum sp.]MDW8063340.1 winged helix-turn-helix transcriptional regulator [Candidatus Caldarchaeum sp.]MDW8434865.1 winged helix-turn-helix transcriptional regulator [Candidatus Caldarchaeum sp.]